MQLFTKESKNREIDIVYCYCGACLGEKNIKKFKRYVRETQRLQTWTKSSLISLIELFLVSQLYHYYFLQTEKNVIYFNCMQKDRYKIDYMRQNENNNRILFV